MSNVIRRTVLVVDDDGDLRDVLRLALSGMDGVSVIEAASGEEALGITQRILPDVILMDVKMPGMGGPAAMATLRAMPGMDAIPVMFLTANPEPVDVERLRALGAAGVVQKPFRPAHLVSELRRTLGWP
jgi:two-component system OmpR family response regulator